MRFLTYLLVLLACFVFQPAAAQDGTEPAPPDDDDTTIEVAEDDEAEPDIDDGYDEEATRRKNEGLAGQGRPDKGDKGAPKLKATLQQRVNEAIKKGVKWLRKSQLKDGSWGPVRANSVYGKPEVRGDFVRDEVGPTAFAIFTLAKCGVKKNDRAIKRGLQWLQMRTLKAHDVMGGPAPQRDETTHGQVGGNYALSTYESAAIVMMIEAVYERSAKLTGKHKKRRLYSENAMSPPRRSKIPKDAWRWMHDRVVHLTVGRTRKVGGARGKASTSRIPGTQNKNGGWRYGQANGDQDLSATQIVLLGLRSASQAGYPIDKVAPNTWKWAANFVRSVQAPDGGFSYQPGHRNTAGMDACGIACLVICKEQMLLAGQPVPPWIDGAIKKGLDHLNGIWNPRYNTGGRHHYYMLYAVERVGDLTGRAEFNGLNWYFRGAEFLLEAQADDGSWTDATAFRPHDTLGTCFALLFLKRATIPTVTVSEK
jgi:hypothetical protein